MNQQTSLLRPMSFGAILDYTFRTYRRYFAAIFLFSLILTGVLNTLYVVGQNAFGLQSINTNPFVRYMELFDENYNDYFDDFLEEDINSYEFEIDDTNPDWDITHIESDTSIDSATSIATAGAMFMLSLLFIALSGIIVTPFVQGGITATGQRFLTNQDVTLKWLFNTSLNKFGRLVVTALSMAVYYMAVALGVMIITIILAIPFGMILAPIFMAGAVGAAIVIMILLFIIIGGLILSVAAFSSLTYSVVMYEDKYHFNAIFRSFQLIGRRFWKSLGITIIVGLIVMVLTSAFNLLAMIPVIADSIGQNLLWDVLQVFISVLVAPIAYIAYSILYFDIRIRTEGYDIENRNLDFISE